MIFTLLLVTQISDSVFSLFMLLVGEEIVFFLALLPFSLLLSFLPSILWTEELFPQQADVYCCPYHGFFHCSARFPFLMFYLFIINIYK